jgi:hypothetical protein
MMQGPAVELGVQLSVLVGAPDEAAALVVPIRTSRRYARSRAAVTW